MNSIWGWGSLKLRNSDTSLNILFPYVVHAVSFEKSNLRQTSITGIHYLTNIMYRPKIKALITLCKGDVSNLIDLIALMNTNDIWISPQYSDSNNTYNVLYECFINSELINFQHIASSLIGQVLTILFIGRRLTKLPYHYSNPVENLVVDLSGNYIVDHDGNNIIVNI